MRADLERTELVERQLFARTLFFGVLPPEVAAAGARAAVAVAEAMRESFHPAGAAIYRAGEPVRRVHFVADGEVVLQAKNEPPWSFRAGDAVGMLDLMQDRPHARTAVAATDARLLSILGGDLLDVLEDHFEFLRGLIVSLSAGLAGLSARLPPDGGFSPPAPPAGRESDRPMSVVDRLVALRGVGAFATVPVEPMAGLARVAEQRRLSAGERLFEPGAPVAHLYVVARGEVAIGRDDPPLAATFGAGTMVGGFLPLGGSHHAFAAWARSPASVLQLRVEDYFDLMEDHFEVGRAALARIAHEREHRMRLLAAVLAAPEPK